MERDSSSLSRSSSSSDVSNGTINSSNTNHLGTYCSPKICKNKDIKRPIHRRNMLRKNYLVDSRANRKEYKCLVRAISVKKAKLQENNMPKSCSGDPFNKSPTQFQLFNTEIALVEPETAAKDLADSAEIMEMDGEIDFSIQSLSSNNVEEFSAQFLNISEESGQIQQVIQGIDEIYMNQPLHQMVMEPEHLQTRNMVLNNRHSGVSCPQMKRQKECDDDRSSTKQNLDALEDQPDEVSVEVEQ